ncbi:hypothetical protein BDBG_07649 [Blastomyces gilchristii SLH14081]|uniref:Alcohol acetyltransferase n=1 Tax=Blastomyces gilchristii (strain SLH14081) TaxID=559298 RepID=A0A179UYJ7_BLAGS|nr:uncharacterized protein BDBG_07649 [Blastomyces gilchristii SLH14081]OAT12289.1 hypothetical protein BDBG_07649 [Blastomyces gilchristii SLH14081]
MGNTLYSNFNQHSFSPFFVDVNGTAAMPPLKTIPFLPGPAGYLASWRKRASIDDARSNVSPKPSASVKGPHPQVLPFFERHSSLNSTLLGLLERYSTARHHLGFYINVAVSATYTLPETCSYPLKSFIYRACKILIGQHPILSVIPVGENTDEPHFVRLPAIDLDTCISFEERRHGNLVSNHSSNPDPDMDLEKLLNIQHNIPFSPPCPFWRLCILANHDHPHIFTASFIFHHAIGDGTSGMAFHKTFLRALHLELSSAESSDQVDCTIVSPNIPLLPNIEALHPMTVSIPFLLSILFREKIWNKQDPNLWTGSKITMPLENEIRLLVLSESQTLSFRDLCRKNKTTITAALHTLVAGAVFLNVSAHYSRLRCVGALSNRRWLVERISDDSMGVFVQNLHDSYHREKFFDQSGNFKFPWDEAVRSRKTIEDTINMKGKNAMPNLLKYVGNFHSELFLSKRPDRRTHELAGWSFRRVLMLQGVRLRCPPLPVVTDA